jgi:carbonic anhydrase
VSFSWAPYGRSETEATTAPSAPPDAQPARRMAVVCCMDGAVVTGDVVKSLEASRELAGTSVVVLVAHSDCKAHGGDDEVARAVVRNGVGRVREALPGVDVSGAFYDVATGRVSGL